VTHDSAKRLTLLHGFTQTQTSWDDFIGDWPAPTDVIFDAIDLPGHGSSVDVRVDGLWGCADWLAHQMKRSVVVGYSQGGRIALHLALVAPHLVDALVLIGATAGIVSPDERAQRKRNDELLARRIEAMGTTAFIDEWMSQPMFAGLPDRPDERSARYANDPVALAWALRTLGTGTQEPLWDRLSEIGCPTLVLFGEHDLKFSDLAAQLTARLPNATAQPVAGSGHATHLEQPRLTAQLVNDWLDGQLTT
jgi:2-succinyl-6-hydroxy-2,4-cyclohexadiene-1-carboxylate synthase